MDTFNLKEMNILKYSKIMFMNFIPEFLIAVKLHNSHI